MLWADEPLTSECGACGVDLSDSWHDDNCPTLRPGFGAEVFAVTDTINACQQFISGAEKLLGHAQLQPEEVNLKELIVWASNQRTTAEAKLKILFPFQERSRNAARERAATASAPETSRWYRSLSMDESSGVECSFALSTRNNPRGAKAFFSVLKASVGKWWRSLRNQNE